MAGAAILAAIEEKRQRIRDRAAWAIQGIERTRDEELAQLDPDAVEDAAPVAAPAAPKPKPKKPGSRKGTKVNSPAAAKERQQKVFDYLQAHPGPVKPMVLRDELDMSSPQLRKATLRLEEAGKVRRNGERQDTTYEAIRQGGAPVPSPTEQAQGTPQGRVLAVIEETGGATNAEIQAKLPDLTEAAVNEACGSLIRDEEVKIERRGLDRVYVPVGGGA